MTIQCVFCHRIKYGSQWREGKAEAGVISYIACPMCIEAEKRKSEKGGMTEDEQIEEAIRRGF